MRYKNFIYYMLYYFKQNRSECVSFVVNLIILISTLCNIKNAYNEKNIWILLWFIVCNVIWQIFSTLSSICDSIRILYMKGEYFEVGFTDDNISEKEKKMGFHLVVYGNQKAIISNQVNEQIQDGNLGNNVLNVKKAKKINSYIKRNFKYLNMFLHTKLDDASRVEFHNEKLLGLAEDIELGKDIQLYKSCYYDAYLTNFIHYYRLYDSNGNVFYSPLYQQFGENIPDISRVIMSNQIGVSTIGFTCDGYIFLLQQNTKADASPEMITPSGSGAANYADFSEISFNNTIVNATNRELYEECGSPSEVTLETIANTKILGFFRWINKGGKPDFLSISKLNIVYNAIIPEEKEQTPQIYAKYCIDFKKRLIDFDGLNGFLTDIQKDEKCSFPLFLNIVLLRQFWEEKESEFLNFIFEE